MIAKKIDAMHATYGIADGICGDCPHFLRHRYHDKILLKCRAYGLTHSEATDWRKRWQCCGLRDLPIPKDAPVFDRIKGQRTHVPEPQCEGQMMMELPEF